MECKAVEELRLLLEPIKPMEVASKVGEEGEPTLESSMGRLSAKAISNTTVIQIGCDNQV